MVKQRYLGSQSLCGTKEPMVHQINRALFQVNFEVSFGWSWLFCRSNGERMDNIIWSGVRAAGVH
jgi:hypothetical protein